MISENRSLIYQTTADYEKQILSITKGDRATVMYWQTDGNPGAIFAYTVDFIMDSIIANREHLKDLGDIEKNIIIFRLSLSRDELTQEVYDEIRRNRRYSSKLSQKKLGVISVDMLLQGARLVLTQIGAAA